jgi:hypothetical protein
MILFDLLTNCTIRIINYVRGIIIKLSIIILTIILIYVVINFSINPDNVLDMSNSTDNEDLSSLLSDSLEVYSGNIIKYLDVMFYYFSSAPCTSINIP